MEHSVRWNASGSPQRINRQAVKPGFAVSAAGEKRRQGCRSLFADSFDSNYSCPIRTLHSSWALIRVIEENVTPVTGATGGCDWV